jgi:pimeloyl-ACP methyl ester carboxylesterase
MISALIAVVIVSGIVLLISLYMTLLSSLYPEQLRTNEVLHLRTDDLWMLRLCRYRKSRASGEPVLFVHGLRSNQHNFTSPENGCLVDYLSSKGYDCWTIDLRGCASSQVPFERTRNEIRLEDFFQQDLPAAVRHILKTTNYNKLHWVGHSMGGMLLHAYVESHGSEQLASATTLAAPYDFNDVSSVVPRWLLNFGINFPVFSGSLVRGCIPFVRLLRIPLPFFPLNRRNIAKRMHSGHFINMMENPVPGVLRQVLESMTAQKFLLNEGEVDIKKGLPGFPVPILAFLGASDPFVVPRRAMQLFETIELEDKKLVLCARSQGFVEDYNHCDLAFGKEAEREIFEEVAAWLGDHSCVKLQENGADPQNIAAAVVSPERRADMLSGAAYSHLKESSSALEVLQAKDEKTAPAAETDKKAGQETTPESSAAVDDAGDALEVAQRRVSRVVVRKTSVVKSDEPQGSQAEKERPVDKLSVSEITPEKAPEKILEETPQVPEKEPEEKTSETVATPVKKKVVPPKKVDVRPATMKARKSKSKTKAAPVSKASPPPSSAPVVPGGLEISPEALARAEAIRAARNESFSQLISDLTPPSDAEKE